MARHKVITIGREFGSGGREIGRKVAENLNIPLYDRRLVSMAAKELGIRKEDAARADESGLDLFVAGYTIPPNGYMEFINAASYIPSFDEKVFLKEAEIIRKLAGKGPCVIVGRCADYVLRNEDIDCINLFICAEKRDRVARISELYGLSEKKAADRIRKTDRERKFYYESHTGLEWGSIHSHQILFNVSMLGIERTVSMITRMYDE